MVAQNASSGRPMWKWLAVSLACSLLSLPVFVGLWTSPAYPTVPSWLACATSFGMQAAALVVATKLIRSAVARQHLAGCIAFILGMVAAGFLAMFLLVFVLMD
jgi:hypothetical protein